MLKTISIIFPDKFKALDFSDHLLGLSVSNHTQKDNTIIILYPSYNDKQYINNYLEYVNYNYRKLAQSVTYTIID